MRTLTRVAAKNFLSLRDIDVHLSDLNVLVGPNGAGKSNFLNIFRFIGDIARGDLIPAVEAFGGFEELAFRGEHSAKRKSIRLTLEGVMTDYAHDNALDEYRLEFHQLKFRNPLHSRAYLSRREELVFKRKSGRGRRITVSGSQLDLVDLKNTTATPTKLSVQESSSGLAILRRLGKSYEAPQIEQIAQIFEQLRLFDVSVGAARRPASLAGSEHLNSDAANIAAFLVYLKGEHPHAFESVREDVSYVLPGFREFEFEQVAEADRAIRVNIVENPLSGSTPLARASFGTIRAIAFRYASRPKSPASYVPRRGRSRPSSSCARPTCGTFARGLPTHANNCRYAFAGPSKQAQSKRANRF